MARWSPPAARVTKRSSHWCGRERWHSLETSAPQPCRREGLKHDRDDVEAIAPFGIRRRVEVARFGRIQGSGQARYRRRLSELRDRLRGMEGAGPENRRQRTDALLHRPFAPPARSLDRRDAAEVVNGIALPMRSWKRLGRQRWVQTMAGVLAAEYLRFAFKTTRFVIDPPDGYARIDANLPVILAMWHGQHFLGPFMRRPGDRGKVLISRHRDAEINAIAAERLGIETIRGSGDTGREVVRKRRP